MIKMAVEQTDEDFYPLTRWTCPECGNKSSFFSVAPKGCAICGKRMPNLMKMQKYVIYRIVYHRENK